MSKALKRLLSLLLVITMVASLTATGWAVERTDSTADTVGGTELELERIDPDTLNVPRIGQIPDDETELREETLPYGLNDIVRVSIVLDEAATLDRYPARNVAENNSATAYRDGLKRRQADMTARIEKAIGSALDVKWNLTLAMNVISANVRYGDIAAIEALSGVKGVELENRYEPMSGTSEPDTAVSTEKMIFATNVWANGYTGAGARVAVIDTGTAYEHKSFSGEAYEYSLAQNAAAKGLSVEDYKASLNLLTKQEISSVRSQLNKSGINTDSVYLNSKHPFAYNYVDGNYDVTHANDKQGEHGSHVAGIAAANRYVKEGGSYVEAADSVRAVGVAPDAQLITMKVFGTGGGAYDSDYMAAIEDAIVLKADAINLSLGSGAPGFAFAGSYQSVMDSLVQSGSVVCISAGNSYAWNDFLNSGKDLYAEDVSLQTGGSPGSYVNSLGVAAAQNVGVTGMPLIFNGDRSVFYVEGDHNGARMDSIAGDYTYVYVDGVGNADEYAAVNAAVSLEGKVVLCNRGSINFSAKGNNAITYKPAALLVANNAAGTINMLLDDYTGSFPMVSITLDDANAIKAASASGTVTVGGSQLTYYTGTVKVTNVPDSQVTTELADATITDFSSWGVPGALIMKPEITAPGGNIWSVNGLTTDGYEDMSGTSMASPHMAGMAALMGQYVRENKLTDKTADGSARHLINSLLMSTAVPMKNDGKYLSVLQQGAGLGNVFAATQARSYVLMGEDATNSYADGKVKAELGQDAKRQGVYSYTFTLNNLSNLDLVYKLSTDMFTQNIYTGDDGLAYLSHETRAMDAKVSYDWERPSTTGHDVDKDGDTDADDAQAILDYVTGKVQTVDLTAADMDDDSKVTAYDAHLLLQYLDEENIPDSDQLLLPAGGRVAVKVTVTLSDAEKARLNRENKGGAYVEGYTYITCTSQTEDGAAQDVRHSIPVLGFYGSWTDASMFDNTSAVDVAYKTDVKTPYAGTSDTNYLTVRTSKGKNVYLGNPYLTEDAFPADRLAMNNETTVSAAKYNMLRSAATVVPAIIGENGKVLFNGTSSSNVFGPWYYVNGGTWQDTASKSATFNKTIKSLGLKDGDKFTVGVFAIPEYYAVQLNPKTTTGTVTTEQIGQLLSSGELGRGAYMGYTVTLDNTVPDIASAKLSADKKTITVTARDDNYLAYLGIMDISGKTSYVGRTPEQTDKNQQVNEVFDISGLNLGSAVAVFAGDYAGNETAYLVKLDEGSVTTETTHYVLTDTLSAGKNYLICNVNAAGEGYILNSVGTSEDLSATEATVLTNENGTYIDGAAVPATAVWMAKDGSKGGTIFQNKDDNGYVGILEDTLSPFYNFIPASAAEDFTYASRIMKCTTKQSGFQQYLRWNVNRENFVHTTASGEVYLYEEVTTSSEVDPEKVTAITVEPSQVKLLLELDTTRELTAKVEPIVATDKSVTWSSSDETVATVDQNGVVTAVGVGNATITATSNQVGDVSGTCGVTVLNGTPVNAQVNAQVSYGENGARFATIDLNTMTVTKLADAENALTGGGRSGQKIYGNDADGKWYEFDMNNGYAAAYQFDMGEYAVRDAANVPAVMSSGTNVHGYVTAGVAAGGALEFIPENGDLVYFTLDANLVALCYKDAYRSYYSTSTYLYYYGLADDGTLYSMTVTCDGTPNLRLSYNALGQITGMPLSDDADAVSMVYAEDMTGEDSVIISDSQTGAIYYVPGLNLSAKTYEATYVGRLKDVTGIAALYNNGVDAVSTLSREELEAINEPLADAVEVEGVTVHLNDRSGADQTAGGLNAVPDLPFLRRAEAPMADAGSADSLTLELTESNAQVSGVYTITYDPQLVTLVSADGALDHCSVNAGNGTVKVAFADKDAVAAGTVIARLTFTANTCDDSQVTVTTNERDNRFGLQETRTEKLAGSGHAYGEPTWEWAEDYSSAKATFVCAKDSTHTRTLDATVTSETVEPTATTDGKTTYTAKVTFQDKDYTDTREVVLPATGGGVEKEVYLLTDSLEAGKEYLIVSTDQAGSGYALGRDNTSVKSVPVTIVTDDNGTYVAADGLSADAVLTTTSGVVFQNGSYNLALGQVGYDTGLLFTTGAGSKWTYYTSGKELTTSYFDREEYEYYDYQLRFYEQENRFMPSLLHKSIYLYTKATIVVSGGEEHTHQWGEPAWTWSDDFTTATATFTCALDDTHVETLDAAVTSVTTPATCEAAGKIVYTAKVTFEGKEYTDTRETAIAATGHDWGEPVWSWSDDFTSATATFTCENDATHTKVENAAVTSETTPATCEAAGKIVYTAKVIFEGKEYTDTRETTIEATGHDWGEWTVTKEPTYDEEGVETRVCKNDPTHVETRSIPRLLHHGWVQDGSDWYYYDENGEAVTGWLQYGTNKAWYYFDENGVMQTGWQQIDGQWRCFAGEGHMLTGWLLDNGKWYYLDKVSGVMKTGWQDIGGKRYYLDETSGVMQTGWLQDGGKWYYLDEPNGHMHTGWVRYGTNKAWYYMGTDGVMQTGWQLVAGKWYFLKDDGVMKTGWHKDGGKWYFLNKPNGDMAVSKWIGNYYVKADGTMAVSEWVDGGKYYVDENGLWVPNKTPNMVNMAK